MKRGWALLLCAVIIFASPIPVRAENGVEDAAAFGLILPWGPEEQDGSDERDEHEDSEKSEDIWEVIPVEPPFDTILEVRDSEARLSESLYIYARNQFGDFYLDTLPVRAQWIGAPYDTFACGNFTVCVTVSTIRLQDMYDMKFTQDEYTYETLLVCY